MIRFENSTSIGNTKYCPVWVLLTGRNHEVPKRWGFSSKILNFEKFSKNLEETERIKIIRNKDKDTFLQENPN